MNSPPPAPVAGLSAIAGNYDAVLSDVWGVVHNGIENFPAACEALARYRAETGGKVLLITNAPRPRGPILEQLDRLHVPRSAFDELLTSGEVTRGLIPDGAAVYHVGPERDMSLYHGLKIALVKEEDADVVCCTGLFDDEVESPEDYRERITRWVARGLPMICANPDIVVERGNSLVPCAGALAAIHAGLGGEVRLVGKPHPPIYAAALHRLDQLAGRALDRRRVLAIGDGVATDVRGAHGQGLDVLFVTAGIHVAEFGAHDRPDGAKVAAFLAANAVTAKAYIPRLNW